MSRSLGQAKVLMLALAVDGRKDSPDDCGKHATHRGEHLMNSEIQNCT